MVEGTKTMTQSPPQTPAPWPIRPSGRPIATINGRPAWQVVAERKAKQKLETNNDT